MIERAFWNDKISIERLAAVLRDGGIAIGSSDTVFGLICSLKCEGKRALDRIKKRVDKPYLVLIGAQTDLTKLIDPAQLLQIENLIAQCWPGPVTLIVRARADLPDFMKGPDGTIALRMPKHEGLQQLLSHFDGLFSTSANISGEVVPTSIEEVDPRVLEKCAVVVLDDSSGKKSGNIPSTILDCTGEKVRVVRQGAYPISELNLDSEI